LHNTTGGTSGAGPFVTSIDVNPVNNTRSFRASRLAYASGLGSARAEKSRRDLAAVRSSFRLPDSELFVSALIKLREQRGRGRHATAFLADYRASIIVLNYRLGIVSTLWSINCLKPIWTYRVQLWGTVSDSNIEIIQRFQNKYLRIIVNAPWFVTNDTLRYDLNVPYVRDEIKKLRQRYTDRLKEHPNILAIDLMSDITQIEEKTTSRLMYINYVYNL